MHTSATAIWIIVVVVIVALAIWLIAVMRAARKPSREPQGDKLLGPVQGGIHVGGGRSVAPRRDEAVDPDQVPAGTTVNPELDSTEPGPEHARRGSGNPLDL
jgi:hypothetical protein